MVGTSIEPESGDARVRAMARSLAHRGPDGEGYWSDPAHGVFLGHRRLAIVDLSPSGHQPMVSASGRFVIVFNGEIYNFESLRAELEQAGVPVLARSDTAVMLAAMERWGIEAATRRFVGMFAYAVWDREERRLTLARDPLGKKPLYVARVHGGLAFASELRALRAFGGVQWELDQDAVASFFRRGYVAGNRAIYRDVVKLAPGGLRSVRVVDGRAVDETTSTHWSPADFRAGGASGGGSSYEEAIAALDARLRTAVAERMIADVPLGAFLSGGVDSSLIVALMQAQSARPVRTFTVGFSEKEYDEAPHARAVAAHLGTDHTETTLSAQDALDAVAGLAARFDEPFADSSQIPTLLVSRVARQHVTVVLSGDGGDELFGGYRRYQRAIGMWRTLVRVPAVARSAAAGMLDLVPAAAWNAAGRIAPSAFGTAPGTARAAQQARKLASVLRMRAPAEVYEYLMAHWPREEAPTTFTLPAEVVTAPHDDPSVDFLDWMMRHDLGDYLPNDVMVKVDRASMAYSLEARAPLLDRRVAELALSLPTPWKVTPGAGKRILRDLLYRYVPRELVDRPKTGFGVPLDAWLRGPLRDWAEALLSPDALARSGCLEAATVRRVWARHIDGGSNHGALLWDVLMFQAWLEANP